MRADLEIKSAGVLEAKPMEELVKIFNSMLRDGELPVKGFESRNGAVKMILERLLEVQEARKKKDRRIKPVFFPVRPPIKPFRGGTIRSKVIQALRKGATIGVVGDIAGTDYRRTRDLLRKMHHASGYGFEQDGDGVIWLITK